MANTNRGPSAELMAQLSSARRPSPELARRLGLADDLLNIEITDERIQANIAPLRDAVSYWKAYPDKFVEFLAGPNSKFKFYSYQRIMLRAGLRSTYTFMTFPRAYSKSFISFLMLIVKALLYPGAKLFTTTAGKQQATNIATEKINELFELIPALKKEVDWKRTQFAKDYVRVVFHNGSQIDVMAAQQSTRGSRRHGGLIEEAILIDGQVLNEVILPTLNVSRRCANGLVDPDEKLNKSQCYVTTSGWKNTFAYTKVLQILIWQVIKPGKAINLGGTWRVPVYCGLLDRSFLRDIREDETFSEESFEREYESVWSGSSADAFFSAEMIEQARSLEDADTAPKLKKDEYYVISVDVARTQGCETVATLIKVTPHPANGSVKKLVNLWAISATHFGEQALMLKKLYYQYQPKQMIIDANGLGVGLMDAMVVPSVDPDSGEVYPGFTPSNDDAELYKKYTVANHDTSLPYDVPPVELNTIFMIKANQVINTAMHSTLATQLRAGRVKFLVDERIKKAELLDTEKGRAMSKLERASFLRPYSLTGVLKEEMLNLREKSNGANIILEQETKRITKDKFSALEMGIYYIKLQEDTYKKRRSFKLTDAIFIN